MTTRNDLEAPVFWEPWRPKVGDRVRVRLSGECHQFHDNDTPGYIDGKKSLYGHHASVNGAIATVEYIRTEGESWAGHQCGIYYDDEVFGLKGSCYAAAELEPLEPAS